MRLGRPKEEKKAFRDAMDLQKALVAEFPAVPDYGHELARQHNHLGLVLSGTGRIHEGERAYRDAIALEQPLVGDFPGPPTRKI
jgi:hypothetical protein